MAFTARVFSIIQQAAAYDEDKIKEALEHQTIKRYTYILHDKDCYTTFDYGEMNEILGAFYDNAVEVNLHIADFIPSDTKYKGKLRRLLVDGEETFFLQDRLSLPKEDFVKKYNRVEVGARKAEHWDIKIRTDAPLEPKTVAKWFGVPNFLVECLKGRGAFLESVEYQTHSSATEQAKGKHLYDDSEVIANFDWRAELNAKNNQIVKYGKKLTLKEEIRMLVLQDGWTLKQIQAKYPVEYSADSAKLKELRGDYLCDNIPMPHLRMNYYVCGAGGNGKGLISKALAKSLYKQFKLGDSENEEEMYFCVGAKKTSFDGYDGQPIIIWEDFRAINLLEALGDRGNVFRVFDPFPNGSRIRQNVKYSSVNLCNTINIVNGIDDYDKFLDELSGEYLRKDGTVALAEDKNQSYRRFQFIVVSYEDSYDLLCNKGFFVGTREYQQWIIYQGIVANFRAIMERTKKRPELTNFLECKAVEPIIIKSQTLVDKQTQLSEETDEEILADFSECGTIDGMTAEQFFSEPVFDDTPFDGDDYEKWLLSEAGRSQLIEMKNYWSERDEAEEIQRLAEAEQMSFSDMNSEQKDIFLDEVLRECRQIRSVEAV